MTNEPNLFVCPVCRAKQVAKPECRRCSADVSLYLKSLRSMDESRRQLDLARESGNGQLASELLTYIQWLSPNESNSPI